METAAPPERSIRLSLVDVKNATEPPSGDQNNDVAPSVPATDRASRSETERIQRCCGSPSPRPVNAIRCPSGETAIPVFS